MRGKLIIFSVIVGILLVLGALYVVAISGGDKKTTKTPETVLSAAAANALSQMGEDKDEDGLIDWEERLWNTNPEKSDTDGDGTGDGEEVSLRRDPLKSGPNDYISAIPVGVSASSTKILETLPEGSFARTFAESYASISAGGTLSTAEKETMAEKLATEIQNNQVLMTQKTAIIKDLRLTNENTKAGYTAYAEAFIKNLKANTPPNPENETTVMLRAVQTNNKADFEKLGIIADSHAKTASDLIATPTPSGLTLPHLEMINALYDIEIAVRGMRMTETEPITGIAALQRYALASVRLGKAILGVSDELKKFEVSL